jgi:hypothetical protein
MISWFVYLLGDQIEKFIANKLLWYLNCKRAPKGIPIPELIFLQKKAQWPTGSESVSYVVDLFYKCFSNKVVGKTLIRKSEDIFDRCKWITIPIIENMIPPEYPFACQDG